MPIPPAYRDRATLRVSEAARAVGVCSRTIHRHIQTGELKAVKRGQWHIEADSLWAHFGCTDQTVEHDPLVDEFLAGLR